MNVPGTTTPETVRKTLYRIPLDGGPAQSQTIELTDYYGWPLWGEDAVYFYRAPKTGATKVTLPNGDSFLEYLPEASLFARPFDGGPERQIATGLPSTWILMLFPDIRGVAVRAVRPYPDESFDLIRIALNGEKPIHIRGFRGDTPPEFHQNRLWWLEFRRVLDAPQSVAQRLVSCRPDGSDRQSVTLDKDADGKKITCQRLALCEGNLYLLYTREDEIARHGGPPTQEIHPYVARLHHDQAELLGKSVQLPLIASQFKPDVCDGGYFYYFAEETRRDTLDFMKEEATDHSVIVFRRIRLPE